jgi:hypothetical protein
MLTDRISQLVKKQLVARGVEMGVAADETTRTTQAWPSTRNAFVTQLPALDAIPASLQFRASVHSQNARSQRSSPWVKSPLIDVRS